MVDEGEPAPRFELPAVRDGEFERISLDEYLGTDVLVIAFYPGDFNPACDDTTTGLDDLDLFTMQKDITILAVSGDSVFSHRAFAEEYDLHVPLLADVRGDVAADYGVAAGDDRYPTERAVFVVDHAEQVEYAWVADDIDDLPDTDEIRTAVGNVGDDRTAQARYRVGHAHYVEGRRAFTSAMNEFEEQEWMMASNDFAQAAGEFDEAREEFNTAVRFADDSEGTRYFERAERKAEALWRAANWLDDAASSFASGEGRRGDELRQDAEGPLETARDIHEPPDPDGFPPDEDPGKAAEEGDTPDLPADDEADTRLDLDEKMEGAAVDAGGADDTPNETTAPGKAAGSPESNIDDDELEAITAELEEQNDAVQDDTREDDTTRDDASDSDEEQPSDGSFTRGGSADAGEADDADVAAIDELENDDLELELTDPTDGEEEENAGEDDEDDDLGGGDHGVPDSL